MICCSGQSFGIFATNSECDFGIDDIVIRCLVVWRIVELGQLTDVSYSKLAQVASSSSSFKTPNNPTSVFGGWAGIRLVAKNVRFAFSENIVVWLRSESVSSGFMAPLIRTSYCLCASFKLLRFAREEARKRYIYRTQQNIIPLFLKRWSKTKILYKMWFYSFVRFAVWQNIRSLLDFCRWHWWRNDRICSCLLFRRDWNWRMALYS